MACYKWRWIAAICGFAICGAGLFATTDVARAVCSAPAPRIQTEVFRSDIVIVGVVAAEHQILDSDRGIARWRYVVQVHDWLWGTGKKSVRVSTDNTSSRLPLTLHGKYLLFARQRGHDLVISGCGNSAELDESALREVRRVIEASRKTSQGDIRGRVVKQASRDVGVAGISFVARRGRAEYRATSDAGGWFHFQVPAGTYSVGPSHGSRGVVAYDLSYDSPRRVVIPRGGGGEVQFLADPE